MRNFQHAELRKKEYTEKTKMEDNKSTTVKKMVKSGITFGSALAMVISYKNLMVSGTNVCWIM